MDPSASEALFDDEVKKLKSSRLIQEKGWRIISTDYPDLVVELPHPSGASRIFRLRCDGWNEQPPSVKSIDKDGNVLEGQPVGPNFSQLSSGWGLCAVGTREYHHHHNGDNPWSANQANITLAGVLLTVAANYSRATA